jgi:hypothetical protein
VSGPVAAADSHPVAEPISGVMNPFADEQTPAPAPPPARSAEDLATAQRLMAVLRAGGDARHRKVRRVRGAVRADAYENDLKLTVAVDRIARDML